MQASSYFTIRRPQVGNPGVMEELAFLLEIDMGTEDNPRFAREKVRPGVAYLDSRQYEERFGINYGRWLVVTTSQTRLENMMAQTEQARGSGLFYFTTFAQASARTILAHPIWHLAGEGTSHMIMTGRNESVPPSMHQPVWTRPLQAGNWHHFGPPIVKTVETS